MKSSKTLRVPPLLFLTLSLRCFQLFGGWPYSCSITSGYTQTQTPNTNKKMKMRETHIESKYIVKRSKMCSFFSRFSGLLLIASNMLLIFILISVKSTIPPQFTTTEKFTSIALNLEFHLSFFLLELYIILKSGGFSIIIRNVLALYERGLVEPWNPVSTTTTSVLMFVVVSAPIEVFFSLYFMSTLISDMRETSCCTLFWNILLWNRFFLFLFEMFKTSLCGIISSWDIAVAQSFKKLNIQITSSKEFSKCNRVYVNGTHANSFLVQSCPNIQMTERHSSNEKCKTTLLDNAKIKETENNYQELNFNSKYDEIYKKCIITNESKRDTLDVTMIMNILFHTSNSLVLLTEYQVTVCESFWVPVAISTMQMVISEVDSIFLLCVNLDHIDAHLLTIVKVILSIAPIVCIYHEADNVEQEVAVTLFSFSI